MKSESQPNFSEFFPENQAKPITAIAENMTSNMDQFMAGFKNSDYQPSSDENEQIQKKKSEKIIAVNDVAEVPMKTELRHAVPRKDSPDHKLLKTPQASA